MDDEEKVYAAKILWAVLVAMILLAFFALATSPFWFTP